jgi:hypothetical protein
MKKRLMMGLATAGLAAALSMSTALAGELKGPPGSGIPNTAAITHANSICVFSGLNDFNPEQGQVDKQTQTPADLTPGAAGHGIPGVFPDGCRGGSNFDRLR